MQILVITASPNEDGLTAACGKAAEEGLMRADAQVVPICLNKQNLDRCHACNNGWGTCRNDAVCVQEDDFNRLHEMMGRADGIVWVTPVYWGDMSESSKDFFDRVRRCEGIRRDVSPFKNKPFLLVAAAGGSGNGTITCLTQMEKLVMHIGALCFDFISIKRLTRQHKLDAIQQAASAMAEYIKSNK
jgi:multimeric flavodoxin WrbA